MCGIFWPHKSGCLAKLQCVGFTTSIAGTPPLLWVLWECLGRTDCSMLHSYAMSTVQVHSTTHAYGLFQLVVFIWYMIPPYHLYACHDTGPLWGEVPVHICGPTPLYSIWPWTNCWKTVQFGDLGQQDAQVALLWAIVYAVPESLDIFLHNSLEGWLKDSVSNSARQADINDFLILNLSWTQQFGSMMK